MESLSLEIFKKRADIAFSDMVQQYGYNVLMLGLYDLSTLSNLYDSMILNTEYT